jgi:hypothetical protein
MARFFPSLLLTLVACDAGAVHPGNDAAATPTWERFIGTPRSAPLWGMPLVAVESQRAFVGFGGAPAPNQPPLTDGWTLSMRDHSWSRILTLTDPPARVHHCSAYLPDQNELLVVGGADENGALPPLAFTLNLATRAWVLVPGELPRGVVGCSAAYLTASARAIVFGGSDDSGPTDETWSYDPQGGIFTQLSPSTSPPARLDSALVEDTAGGRLLLYGGKGTDTLGDLWAFDGQDWSPIDAADPPPARRGAFVAFGSDLFVFGGFDATAYSDVLRFDAAAGRWSAVQITPGSDGTPSARGYGGAGWDAMSGQLLAFGGLGDDGNSALSDGWQLTLP